MTKKNDTHTTNTDKIIGIAPRGESELKFAPKLGCTVFEGHLPVANDTPPLAAVSALNLRTLCIRGVHSWSAENTKGTDKSVPFVFMDPGRVELPSENLLI